MNCTEKPPVSRVAEIEKELKIKIAENKTNQESAFLTSSLKGKLLRVKNSNGSSFLIATPRSDSLIADMLAVRRWGMAALDRGLEARTSISSNSSKRRNSI